MDKIGYRNWQRLIDAKANAIDDEAQRLEEERPGLEQAAYYEGYEDGRYKLKLAQSGKVVYAQPQGLQTNGAIAKGQKVMVSQSKGASPLFYAMPNNG